MRGFRLKVNLDDVLQSLVDGLNDMPPQQLCAEAATILLELVKAVITEVISTRSGTFLYIPNY